jgi:hypothetical protein
MNERARPNLTAHHQVRLRDLLRYNLLINFVRCYSLRL